MEICHINPSKKCELERRLWSLSLSATCSAMVPSNGLMSFISLYLGFVRCAGHNGCKPQVPFFEEELYSPKTVIFPNALFSHFTWDL